MVRRGRAAPPRRSSVPRASRQASRARALRAVASLPRGRARRNDARSTLGVQPNKQRGRERRRLTSSPGMQLDGAPYLLFLAVVVAVYHLAAGTPRRQNAWLVVAGLVFYGWLEWRLGFLLLAYALTGYGGGRWI